MLAILSSAVTLSGGASTVINAVSPATTAALANTPIGAAVTGPGDLPIVLPERMESPNGPYRIAFGLPQEPAILIDKTVVGIRHLEQEGKISRHDFARKLLDALGLQSVTLDDAMGSIDRLASGHNQSMVLASRAEQRFDIKAMIHPTLSSDLPALLMQLPGVVGVSVSGTPKNPAIWVEWNQENGSRRAIRNALIKYQYDHPEAWFTFEIISPGDIPFSVKDEIERLTA